MNPLDDADQLSAYRDRFVESPGVISYLDGNSLGRPLTASAERIARFAAEEWATKLIRGWDAGWLDLPVTVGDELGRVALGASPGQTVIGDSTTVLLYKLVRAAVSAAGRRNELVIDRDNFPTDRYVLEGVATECGLVIRWLEAGDVTPERVAEAVGQNTALVVLSSVSYRSGFLADLPVITEIVHDAGSLILWDLCHSAGVVPTSLDGWEVDLAVGCNYKYLNGGPGAPAFAYVRRDLQSSLRQPIQGWLGSRAPFEMRQGYEPAEGIRGFLSGTPPIIGMLALQPAIALVDEAGLPAIRAKSIALTEYAIALADERLPEVRLSSPRDPTRRGSHVTLDHPRFESILPGLWAAGVIPDFRRPTGIRLGLSPLSTSFAEIELGIDAIASALAG